MKDEHEAVVMFQVLLESRAPKRRRAPWTTGSIAVHAAIIAAAIGLTARAATPVDEPVTIDTLIFVPMPSEPAPSPPSPTIALPHTNLTLPTFVIPDASAPIEPNVVARWTPDIVPGPQAFSPIGNSNAAPPSHGAVHTVDQIVVALAGNRSPVYPSSLRAAALEGDVLARFVVDTIGQVELESIAIVEATHPAFGDAVRRWLPLTRYRPASAGGVRVRQLVQQRVQFTLRP